MEYHMCCLNAKQPSSTNSWNEWLSTTMSRSQARFEHTHSQHLTPNTATKKFPQMLSGRNVTNEQVGQIVWGCEEETRSCLHLFFFGSKSQRLLLTVSFSYLKNGRCLSITLKKNMRHCHVFHDTINLLNISFSKYIMWHHPVIHCHWW